MFTPNRKGQWPRRDIEQIAGQLQVLERQGRGTKVIGGPEYFGKHGGRVLVEAEGIEGGRRIGIKQRLTQSIGVDNPAVALHAAIFAITKSAFPVPGLKIISKLTQIAFEAAGKLVIIRCDLDGARPGFQRTVCDDFVNWVPGGAALD